MEQENTAPPAPARPTWRGRVLAIPYQVWNKIDPKKTDSWLAAVLGIFLRTAGILLLLFAILIIWRMMSDTGFALQPFSVSKRLDENGLSGSIAALRLQDAIQTLKDEAASIKKDELHVGSSDANAAMNVQVMGVEVSLTSIAYQLRHILGKPQKRITGEFVQSGERLSLLLRMSGFPNARFEEPCPAGSEETAAQNLLRLGAETVLQRTDPYRLAVVQYRRKNYTAAIDLARIIIKDRPEERVWAYHAWGNILAEQGRLEEAIAKFRRATELDSTFAMAYQRWAHLLMQQRKRPEAIEKLEKSLRFNPENPDTWMTLGWQYVALGQLSKADSAYAASVRLAAGQSYEPLAWQAWMGAKMDQDSMAAALKLAQKAIEKASETADGYVTRGMAYLLQRDTVKAFEAGMRALELDPNNAIALRMVTRGLFAQKKYREVVTVTQGVKFKAWQMSMATEIFNLSAMSHNFLGQHDSAFAVIRRTIAQDTLYGTPYSTLAETYAFVGKKQLFYENLEKAFRLGMRPEMVDWSDPPYDRFRTDVRAQALREKYAKKEAVRN
ncbi:MAG: tetratricopeptide repeat protein [Saprospiraceae bacterium]